MPFKIAFKLPQWQELTKRKKIILGLSLLLFLVLVSTALFFIFAKKKIPFIEPGISEIDFSQQLIVSQGAIASDKSAFEKVECTTEGQPRKPFGYIYSQDKDKLEMFCTDGFMGGISLSFKDHKNELQVHDLAMREGDAGTYWDTRSWITFNERNEKLTIHTVTLSSSLDETGQVNDCRAIHAFYYWDSTIKDFVKYESLKEPEVPHFAPPIGVVPECLDERGYWKGS